MPLQLPPTVRLSPQKLRIVQLVSEGKKNSDIADVIGTSELVMKNYLHDIYDRTGMCNRVELALWYLAHTETDSKVREHL
jgi:DNA-binding NarL/FixJ family response regulator